MTQTLPALRRLAALAILALAQAAQAAPPSRESIENLLVLTRAEAMMDVMYDGIRKAMRQAMQERLKDKTLSPERQRFLEVAPEKLVAVIRQEFNWDSMRPMYIQLYSESFEQEEIDGLIAFYQSPTGQAFVGKMPAVIGKSMALMQGRMQSLMPKVAAAVDEAVAQAEVAR